MVATSEECKRLKRLLEMNRKGYIECLRWGNTRNFKLQGHHQTPNAFNTISTNVLLTLLEAGIPHSHQCVKSGIEGGLSKHVPAFRVRS